MPAIGYNLSQFLLELNRGEMAEWSKAPPWKGGIGATLSRVRIPLSPPALSFDLVYWGYWSIY